MRNAPVYAERSKVVALTWTCTSCGHTSTVFTALQAGGIAHGAFVTNAQLREEAAAGAAKSLAEMVESIGPRQRSSRFWRDLGLDCACEKCGRRELWAFGKPHAKRTGLLIGLLILLGFALLILLIVLRGLTLPQRLLIALGYACIPTMWALLARRKERRLDAELARLPDAAFPVPAPDRPQSGVFDSTR